MELNLSEALAATEGKILVSFRLCVGAPGLAQRELADLSEQFEHLHGALKAAPTDAKRLEIMESAAKHFSEIAKKKGLRP